MARASPSDKSAMMMMMMMMCALITVSGKVDIYST